MRKIYSLVLIAAALLIGTNAWAKDYTISLGAQFDDAWSDVATNGGKITLNSDITVSSTATSKIYWLGTENMDDAAKTVEIDLNGNTMEFDGQFLLTHGTLKITTPAGTEGSIAGKKNANLFYVTGSTKKDVDPSLDNVNYFTHLYIGEGVTVSQPTNTGYSAAIRIEVANANNASNAISDSKPVKPALSYLTNIYVVPCNAWNNGNPYLGEGLAFANKGVAYGVRIDVHGTVIGRKYGIQTGGYLGSKSYYDDKMSKLMDLVTDKDYTIASKVIPAPVTMSMADTVASLDHTKPFYAQIKSSKGAGSYAVDNIKNHVFGTNDDETYASYVRIYPTGVVKADEDLHSTDANKSDQPFGIYSGGYGRWKVEGYVTGCTGALIKSGIVDFENATVEGTGSEYRPANNSGSGSAATGCGIVISTEDSYVGETQVTVQGDSYVAANNGYALEEIITTQSGAGDSKVEAITIDGGTFAGGKIGEDPNTGDPIEGTITITEKTADKENTVYINGLSVTGTGGYITEATDGVKIGTQSLEQYFSDKNIHITTVPDGDGTSTYVISIGNAPTPGNLVSTNADNSNASVKWITNTEDVITTGRHLKLAELEINDFTDNEKTNPREQTLTIQSGATLEVGRVILGPKAHIIVKAGGKLLVTGTDGIIANQYDNITLESSEGAQAIFLFHPLVSSNRHPKATVQLTSKGYRKANGQKVWQRFGVPSYTSKVEEGAVIRYSIDPEDNPVTYNYAGWIDVYDYSIDNWKTMPDADAFVPFQCYAASSVATEANQTVYTFKCPLMGNADFTLPVNGTWNYYANSYMAPIDIKEMLTDFVSNNANLEATVYVYRSADNWWDALNLGDFGGYFATPAQTTIDPMQAFIFRVRDGEKDAVINYKKHIYNPDPTTTPVAAPARNREVSAGTAMIEIAAADGAKDKLYLIESDNFSAEYDNGYDAAKYMNESFNLFASVNDEKMAKVATDNLEGTVLGMNTKEQTSFTMTISHVNNINYAIRDNFTGTEIEMVEGATYMFSTAANANIEGRFEIVPVAKMPTAIENIEATAAAKGIYTVTGQFVGNDYHSLPNGIYVVDGKKIVK
jgi:hypothetical protein